MREMRKVRGLVAGMVGVMVWGGVMGEGWGWTVAETEEAKVEVMGLMEAGVVWAEEGVGRESGPQVGMGRLGMRARYEGVGEVMVQYEGAPLNGRLLDAVGGLYLVEGMTLRLGRFKTPVSQDFTIGASRKPFASRSLLVGLTPRRATGGELEYEREVGAMEVVGSVGAFDTSGQDVVSTDAMVVTGKGAVRWSSGLEAHLGYVENLWNEESGEVERLLDVGVKFENERFFAHGEAVVAPVSGEGVAGTYGAFGVRFAAGEGRRLEPIVGYEWLNGEVEDTHRVRGGVNLYLLEHRVVPSVHYEGTLSAMGGGGTGHAVLALVRVGL